MSVRFAITAAALLAGFAAPALAADMDAIQQRQQERIREGIRSGQLSRHEVARLQQEQERIGHMIRRARLDGRVDAVERAEIQRAQEEASRHIFTEKHDTELRSREPEHRRWWHRWGHWN